MDRDDPLAVNDIRDLVEEESGDGEIPAPDYYDEGAGEDSAALRALLPVGRSAWAIAAGYLGLFSVLILPAPFAVLTGVLGIREIRRNPEKHGLPRSLFGIVMGTIFTGVGAVALLT